MTPKVNNSKREANCRETYNKHTHTEEKCLFRFLVQYLQYSYLIILLSFNHHLLSQPLISNTTSSSCKLYNSKIQYFYCLTISMVMARNGYKRISTEGETGNVSFVSLLFFQWMNSVFKTGNERALEEDDFLPLSEENFTCTLTEQLQTDWNKESEKCKSNGKKPKLWKSVLKMVSFKEGMIIIFTGVLYSGCLLLQPLLLGYLISALLSTPEPQNNYLLYGCAIAMGINALISSLSMHHFFYRCELLSIRIGSSLKGLVYAKVSPYKLAVKNRSLRK